MEQELENAPLFAGFVHQMNPVLLELGPIRLWYYGLAYALGFLTVHVWILRQRVRLGWSREEVLDFSLLFTAGALLVGRAFHVVVYGWDYFRQQPEQVLNYWGGGMASHGVLLGAALGTALFCRLRNKSFLQVADEVVIPGAVLLALGRVANHINGEIYGSRTEVSWAVQFPYADGFRHPVALYEGAKNLLLVPLLLYIRRNPERPPGLLLGHFVFWYAFLRLVTDYFRDYESYWLGIGRGQYFNFLTAVLGLGIILAVRPTARPAGAAVKVPPNTSPGGGYLLLLKRVSFCALVAFSLTIPGAWPLAILEAWKSRVSG
jgi:phosphatidylglycerol:prolipoprotein diacylglycerol transferase